MVPSDIDNSRAFSNLDHSSESRNHSKAGRVVIGRPPSQGWTKSASGLWVLNSSTNRLVDSTDFPTGETDELGSDALRTADFKAAANSVYRAAA